MLESNSSHHRLTAPTRETLRWLTLMASLALAATTLIYWIDRLVALSP